jgi:hypothetical protein
MASYKEHVRQRSKLEKEFERRWSSILAFTPES